MASYSLQAAGKGKWRAFVSLGYDEATGKYPRRTKTIRAGGVKEARQLAQVWADSIDDEAAAGVDTVADLCAQYLEAKAPDWRPSTFDNTDSMLRTHFLPELGAIKLAALNRRTVSDWQAHRKGSKNTRSNHYRQMKSILLWAAKTGRMSRDHAADLIDSMTPIGRDTIDAPAAGDVATILATARAESPQTYALIRLATVSGLRRAELAGLQLGDWDPDNRMLLAVRSFDKRGQLAEVKTKASRRRVVLDATTATVIDGQAARVVEFYASGGLDVRPDPTWPLFITRDGGHIPIGTITKTMARIRQRAGLPKGAVWMHGLRHTSATELRALGIDPLVVQGRLGHTNTATTDNYTTVLPAAEIAAADAIGTRIDQLEA